MLGCDKGGRDISGIRSPLMPKSNRWFLMYECQVGGLPLADNPFCRLMIDHCLIFKPSAVIHCFSQKIGVWPLRNKLTI